MSRYRRNEHILGYPSKIDGKNFCRNKVIENEKLQNNFKLSDNLIWLKISEGHTRCLYLNPLPPEFFFRSFFRDIA